jgi:Nucleoside-diphosphate-sugar pyrophosphorylase involved in lipopolysaccharide biosynthesis/translation initiation factor 2B, gamma/epsilon subunits (eIF-2Bgamma/eIF-2Bepsilon)
MNRHIIHQYATIIEALRRLNELSGDVMTLIVTDESNRMLGTVTDGDIRRGLLNGVTPADLIDRVIHTGFMAIHTGQKPLERINTLRQARKKGIALLPELRPDGTINRLINLNRTDTLLPLTAILMAGGQGERLRPLTLTTPKPLLEIDGRPIIDYNIERLARAGITDVWVTVRYLASQIKDYFATPRHGLRVKCVEETTPLGTIGSAALVPRTLQGDTLVMNSDLLTTVNLEEMYLRHIEENADITIAAIPYTVSVPYAILSTEGTKVTALEEKPTYSHMANAGIYIFSNRVLSALSPDEHTDATELIEAAMNQQMTVTYYPINGTWIDIGSPADFRHARELMRHHHSFNSSK